MALASHLVLRVRPHALQFVAVFAIGALVAACGGSAAAAAPATAAPALSATAAAPSTDSVAGAGAAAAGPWNSTDAAASYTIGAPYTLDAADPALSQKIQGAIGPGMTAYSDVGFGSRYISNNGTRVGYFYVLKLPGTITVDSSFAQGFASAGGAGATPTTQTLGGKSVTVVNGAQNVMGVWTGTDSVVVVAVSPSAAADAPAIIGALASANP